jgi:hypothetical protein
VTKTTSFDGDLADQERVRAKLADVVERIAEQQNLLTRVEDELMRLERLREGLLVIVGDKEAESDGTRSARLTAEAERERAWGEQLQAIREVKSIQAEVENLVNALGRPVTADDLLAHLPPGTKRATVNWALHHHQTNKRIAKISHGLYAPKGWRDEHAPM